MSLLAEGTARPDAADRPDYTTPPVVEVVLAVSYKPMPGLGMRELIGLWRDEFEAEFPDVEEQGPVQMQIEQLDQPGGLPSFSLEMATIPLLPRLWFIGSERNELVQIQRDWFARNWRKMPGGTGYARYVAIRDAFRSDFGKLIAYAAKRELGDVTITQCEISYINHIDGSASETLSFLQDPVVPGMPRLEGVSVSASYVLEHDAKAAGRLYVEAKPAIERSTGKRITVLTLTARGRPLGGGIDGAMQFFDLGAESTLRAFDHLTEEAMHKKWGRHP